MEFADYAFEDQAHAEVCWLSVLVEAPIACAGRNVEVMAFLLAFSRNLLGPVACLLVLATCLWFWKSEAQGGIKLLKLLDNINLFLLIFLLPSV